MATKKILGLLDWEATYPPLMGLPLVTTYVGQLRARASLRLPGSVWGQASTLTVSEQRLPQTETEVKEARVVLLDGRHSPEGTAGVHAQYTLPPYRTAHLASSSRICCCRGTRCIGSL